MSRGTSSSTDLKILKMGLLRHFRIRFMHRNSSYQKMGWKII